ncbi:DUF342 domain-containing protein [Paenisporosarcina cavernae]|uniref:DUF342 domain-containing protein n=1 Tax=Paenisporosarcina cavernae TaxID=2320858 RepID=A0A385YVK2_9BACL|nr:FapA family protein [Paenisporosarcina cavernae]AYC29533.1 DUF342 domain-containing protein [Paenisporosarcina cavernae]
MLTLETNYFHITEDQSKVKIKVIKSGASLRDIDQLIRTNSRIKLTNIAALKSILVSPSEEEVEIGYLVPNVELDITKDEMSAILTIHEFDVSNQDNIASIELEVEELLERSGIVHGIKDIHFNEVRPGKPFEIAKGIPPIKGQDAFITYKEMPDRKPIITETGKADYYDMNFLEEVSIGDWLGEKTEAQEGTSGTTVLGNKIPAEKGADTKFLYDRKTVEEKMVNGKWTLVATVAGVLDVQDGVMGVSKHLVINGDVGPETGNLKFDGSITIRGTVLSGFSVVAAGDIAIESTDGVLNAGKIHAVYGDIFIRGGIFGKNESTVEAGKSIYIKHANEAILHAKGDVHIGYYALGSFIQGKNVFVDPHKGKIIGGQTEAVNKIVTGTSGNHLERKTILIVSGINKIALQDELKVKASILKELQADEEKLSNQLTQFQRLQDKATDEQKKLIDQVKNQLDEKQKTVQLVDKEIQTVLIKLRSPMETEISIHTEAFPGTVIQIGHKSKALTSVTKGTFLLENGELNV